LSCDRSLINLAARFYRRVYADSSDDLNFKVCQARGVVQLLRLEAVADEMWSFVVSKKNKQWIMRQEFGSY
jgi:hypothetical protein